MNKTEVFRIRLSAVLLEKMNVASRDLEVGKSQLVRAAIDFYLDELSRREITARYARDAESRKKRR